MPKKRTKFVLHPITMCFIQVQLLLQYCGCHDEAKYKVSNTAECAPRFRISVRTCSLYQISQDAIFICTCQQKPQNLFFMAGKTPFFPKLPKIINYILKKRVTCYCRRSTSFHGEQKDGF